MTARTPDPWAELRRLAEAAEERPWSFDPSGGRLRTKQRVVHQFEGPAPLTMREGRRQTCRAMKRTRMPRDVNQRAKATLDLMTGEAEAEPEPERQKDPRAVESGRRGGQIGGAARAAKLTPEQRSASARAAAQARWAKSAQE